MPPQPPHHKEDLKLPHELEPLAKSKSSTPGLVPAPAAPKSRGKKKSFGILFLSVVIGTVVTMAVGMVMIYFKLPVTVVLPVLAPIWVGSITLTFMAWKESK